jgi:hypothetical protein
MESVAQGLWRERDFCWKICRMICFPITSELTTTVI